MGGGEHAGRSAHDGGRSYHGYPKQVWSSAGGWYGNPKTWRANTAVALVGYFGIVAAIFSYSISREKRYGYPTHWVPSMLWSKQFDDPNFQPPPGSKLAREKEAKLQAQMAQQ
ncbi:hypothetical protein GQ42DRAFT_166125 [Ramicandelaber brevisporus]|nr:hypothetical protein GQ42DRAFT_166125 [Ramicandelaber brevisporus]